jgi:SAM-dependent methyltransferase
VDATSMKFENEFDVVLCMNLLEHVYDFQMVIDNIYDALTKNGLVVILVPAFYPLHDEPHDYWRFTEHSLRKLLNRFSVTMLEYSGIRQYPFAYYVEAVKDH